MGLVRVVIVLICGDRNWSDASLIRRVVAELPAGTVVLAGAARGADALAASAAKALGYEVREFPADWKRFGNGAGVLRNRAMLDAHPDRVIAFHDDLQRSRGTRDCVEEAQRREIAVTVIRHGGV